jgi:hypothetical protein
LICESGIAVFLHEPERVLPVGAIPLFVDGESPISVKEKNLIGIDLFQVDP